MYTFICVYLCTCIYLYIYVMYSIHLYVYIYVHVYIYIYTSYIVSLDLGPELRQKEVDVKLIK
jgi:hypothetical protein